MGSDEFSLMTHVSRFTVKTGGVGKFNYLSDKVNRGLSVSYTHLTLPTKA